MLSEEEQLAIAMRRSVQDSGSDVEIEEVILPSYASKVKAEPVECLG